MHSGFAGDRRRRSFVKSPDDVHDIDRRIVEPAGYRRYD
jgi:hypothetical protein